MYYVRGTTHHGCTKVDSVLVTVLNSPLGISDETLSGTDFNVYPVPSTGILNLEVHKQQESQVAVYNTLGQCILRKAIPANRQEPLKLDLSKAAPGIYTVQVISENKIATRKVVLE